MESACIRLFSADRSDAAAVFDAAAIFASDLVDDSCDSRAHIQECAFDKEKVRWFAKVPRRNRLNSLGDGEAIANH